MIAWKRVNTLETKKVPLWESMWNQLSLQGLKCCSLWQPTSAACFAIFIRLHLYLQICIYIYCIYLYIYITRIIITIQTFIYCVVLHTSIWNKEPFFNIIQHATEICRNHNDLGKLLRSQAWIVITVPNCGCYVHMAVCQNLVPLVNIKIAGKWCSSH